MTNDLANFAPNKIKQETPEGVADNTGSLGSGWEIPGVGLFCQLSLAMKSALLAVIIFVPLCALIIDGVLSRSDEALKAKMDATRQHVEVALSMVQWSYDLQQAGELNEQEAKANARQAVGAMRYDVSEYFWINDLQPRMIMHPIKPALDGSDVGDIKDPNGLALFVAFADTVREHGSGFVEYQWPRPGSDTPVNKLSYVQGFEPWGWVIGSGIYIDELAQQQRTTIQRSVGVIAMILVLVGYGFVCFYQSLKSGMRRVSRHLSEIADGNLTCAPLSRGRDESAQLMSDLGQMQLSLQTIVSRVRDTSDDILHSSSEIASGAKDLSRRTEHAASNLEESAASMEQITSTVKSSANNTQEASSVAHNNAQIAVRGGEAMREVANTMQEIQSSSSKIGEITTLIDGIAFQTNLLALNAAVEAARAGEQGRGFAVVASEVRALAHRSAEAAKDIKDLVGSSGHLVSAGTDVVHRACSTIDDLVNSSDRMNKLLGDISIASQEQSIGVTQIGQAVAELDSMTNQNAALVEETAAAAADMKEQASMLTIEVSRFKVPMTGNYENSATCDDVSQFDFDTAIKAHRQWKVKLRQAIAHREKLDVDIICQDNQCPLGKWIYGEGRRQNWGTAAFDELTQRHADFHVAAGDVARTINAGRYADAEQLIGSGSQFAEVSSQVSSLLTKAKRWTGRRGR